MASLRSVLVSTGLVALASAFTNPNFQDQTFGALYTPDTTSPVTQGQTYKVTWDASKAVAGETVALVLCSGPGANCVLASSAIVDGLDATTGSYEWAVPCSLPAVAATATTGNGMLIIVDGTGQFQYSTQFSVLAGSSCSSSSTTSSSTSSSSTSTSSSSSSTSVSTTSSSSTWASWNGTSTSTTATPSSTAVWTTSTASSMSSPVYTLPTAANPTTATATGVATASASPSAFHGAATREQAAGLGAAAVAAAVALFAL